MFPISATTCLDKLHTREIPEALRDRFPEFDDDGFAARAICAARGMRLCTVREFDTLFHCNFASNFGGSDPRAAGCLDRVPVREEDGANHVSCEYAFGGVTSVDERGLGHLQPVLVDEDDRFMSIQIGVGPTGFRWLCAPAMRRVRCCLDL